MRKYEVVAVLVPGLSEDEVQAAAENYVKSAEGKGAGTVKVDHWGKRRLAYPIKKHAEGYYVVLTIEESAAQAVAELERRFKVSDQVLRYLTIRIDLDEKRAEKSKAKREARKQRSRVKPAPVTEQSETVA